MAKRFNQLGPDLLKIADGFKGSIDNAVADTIGTAIVARMLDVISKGISPIQGAGRFPEYKGVAGIGGQKALLKGLGKDVRSARESKRLGESGLNLRAALSSKRLAKKALNNLKKKTYPYSVQKAFPSKKPRPVNLLLSGKFLNSLDFSVIKSTIGKAVVIEYKNALSKLKEQGHREGVGGQPKRPTIPVGSEKLSNNVLVDAAKVIAAAFNKYLKGV